MEELIRLGSEYVALFVEAAAAVVIAFGTVEALIGLVPELAGQRPIGRRRNVWRRFGVWLLLGLEFELAADVIRTAISPSWTDIGQLASIAIIRTALNYFLEIDLEKLRKQEETQAA